MRLGINLPFHAGDGGSLDIAGISERARRIEEAGFDSVWVHDSLVPALQPRPDPLAWLLVAATATTRLEVGTSILIVPTRNPVDLAQRVLTLHLVTGGRFTFGVGAGSTAGAHEAAGVPFENRFRLLHEGADTIRRLCRGEQVGAADLRPWAQTVGGPPMLLGAWGSDISLRKAVRSYDGWICSAARTSLSVISDGIKRYRDLGGARAVVGSCPIDLTKPTTPLGPDDPFSLRCRPEDAAERLQLLVDLGFDDVALTLYDDAATGPRHHDADATRAQLDEIRRLLPASVAARETESRDEC